MNSVPYSICFATIALWATMSIPALAQEPVGGSQGTPQGSMELTTSGQILNLHKVTLQTKIKWSAQLLFYPKALKFIIALHAYKLDDDFCRLPKDLVKQDLGFAVASFPQKKDLAEQDLGFAVASFPQKKKRQVVGYSLIRSHDDNPPTLAKACDLLRGFRAGTKPPSASTIHKSWTGETWTIRGLRDGETGPHLLLPFAIENEIPHDLYWTTNLSNEMYYQRMKER